MPKIRYFFLQGQGAFLKKTKNPRIFIYFKITRSNLKLNLLFLIQFLLILKLLLHILKVGDTEK